MSASKLLKDLGDMGVKVWAKEGGRLRYKAEKGIMTPQLLEKLTVHKSDILEILQADDVPDTAYMPVETVSRDAALPLSFAQERLWFLAQLESDSAFYNSSWAYHISGSLDKGALKQSLNHIVQRQESLRTTFPSTGGTPGQLIAANIDFELEKIDLQAVPEDRRRDESDRIVNEEARRPFDLSTGPLFRATLMQMGDAEHVLVLTMHHIVTDGWSMEIFFREISVCYEAYSRGKTPRLPDLPIQYADFAVWQREWLRGDVLERLFSYWEKQLGDSPPILELPADHPRPAVQTYSGAKTTFILPKELSDALKDLRRSQDATLFMILLAAFNALLYRYTGQEDILIGSPTASRDRNREEIEGLIGFFVNTVVLRTDFSDNPNFIDLLNGVKETVLNAYMHQDLPFEKLVDELSPERNLSHSPLFQVMFVLQNAPWKALSLSDLKLTHFESNISMSKFDLTLFMIEGDDELSGAFNFKTDLFDAETIKRMADHFQILIEGIVAEPDQPIASLPLLTKDERNQLLVEFNDTAAEYPADRCIHHLFEDQAEKTPDAVAVVFPSADQGEDEKLTYKELNEKSNQLAHYLRSLGVGPEVLVGMCVERSIEMIVGLLGILKAGGAYVPLDPEYPRKRLEFMLKNSGAGILLVHEKTRDRLCLDKGHVVNLNGGMDKISAGHKENPDYATSSENFSYVIYTSGSTGKPKGAAICHKSVVNLFCSLQKIIYKDLKEKLNVSINGSFSFDTSVKQIVRLLSGDTLYIIPEDMRFDSEKLLTCLQANRLDVFDCTPLQLGMLLESDFEDYIKPGAAVLIGGEAISPPLWNRLQGYDDISFYNLYGPTEYAVDTAICHISERFQRPCIGKPVLNTKIYILDEKLNPVPVGVPGEIHITGAGLFKGYLKDKKIVKEKTVRNPFSDGIYHDLYKTGDSARWLPDGNIEFLGRIDSQVKIRGFRIEPGEIESVLSSHEEIKENAVAAREKDSGDKHLVAYIVEKTEGKTDQSELREYLKESLPEYMIPSFFVFNESGVRKLIKSLMLEYLLYCQGQPLFSSF